MACIVFIYNIGLCEPAFIIFGLCMYTKNKEI